MKQPLLVAIDGPGGSGKSTVAREVARRLQLPYLDTGAMYRAAGWALLERRLSPSRAAAVERLVESLDFTLVDAADGGTEILVNGVSPGAALRLQEVGEVTSRIAALPGVRRRMVELQRAWAAQRGGVVEGRDIGTRVFPETPHKFFLTATPERRAERRWLQLRAAGDSHTTLAQVLDEVAGRDRRDSSRALSPLRCDETYDLVDTSDLDIDEVVERIVATVQRRVGGLPAAQ